MGVAGSGRLERAAHAAIAAVFRVLGLLTPPSAALLAGGIGRIWFCADARHRRIALENLERAFGPGKSHRALARRVFQQLARLVFEIGRHQRIDLEKDRALFAMEGLEHLNNARRQGRGVLFLTAHIGNWEILPAAAAMLGLDLNVVYRPLDFKPLNRFLEESRTRFGARLIPTARAMRPILAAIEGGGCVALLMDQNFDCREGVFADFFGTSACTNKGLALLARRTGAPVVPVFLVRRPGGFRVLLFPRLAFVRTGDKTKDLEVNTEAYNRAIEAVVRRYPDQWFWVHQRWKTKTCHPWPRVRSGP